MSKNLIHFNERKRMCFDKEKQKNVKMYLIYELFKTKVVCVCLQQQTKMQNIIMKINVINIVKKLFEFENEINNEKKIHDENMLIKVRIIHQEIDFSRRKIFWKSFLKQFARVLKNKKQKKVNLSTIKNVRNDNYFNAINLVEQTILIDNIKMIKMIVKINSESRATKY